MAENYLITGYWGEPHVTSENDRGINAAIFGAGRFVLPVGEQFRAAYIGNNTVRIYDGKLIDNGAVAGIPAGEYVDLLIPEAGQGMNRNDLIVFQYSQDAATLIESGVFTVLSGEETSGTASDPVLSHQDILTNEATMDQMALWRVPVSGSVISTPEILFNTKFAGERIVTAHSENGENYTVELPGIAKLYTGLEFTIIPDTTSTTTLPKLNVNGLGDVNIKRRISGSTSITVQSESESFLVESYPIRIFYNGKFWIADMARPHATDIYGAVPIKNGGTGADNAEEARANLGAAPAGDYATVSFVTNKIAEAQLSGGGSGNIDLSGYATKDDLTKISHPVNSVNGKTGAVQLNAGDVGARPSSWTPTPDQVGAVSAATPSLANVSVKAWATSLTGSAWAYTDNTTLDMPTEVSAANNYAIASAKVTANGGWIELRVRYILTGCEAVAIYNYGWSGWEWENPPMATGMGYKTTERWNGYPVYVKLIDMGALPNNSTKEVSVSSSAADGRIISAEGFESGSGQKIPSCCFANKFANQVELPFSGLTLWMHTNFNGSAYTQALITVKYVRY